MRIKYKRYKYKNSKPILIGEYILRPWKSKKEKVFLSEKGEIFSDSLRIHDRNDHGFRYDYEFIKKYLDKKRKAYDVSRFFEMSLNDLKDMLWMSGKKSISTKRIEEILRWDNQIAYVRKLVEIRFRKYVLKEHYKELGV